MNQKEKIIDPKDILVELLFKWKIILLATIVGIVAGAGISGYKTRQYQSALAEQQAQLAAQQEAAAAAAVAAQEAAESEAEEPGVHNGPYDEQMADAKAMLTQLEITKVDGLYAQYAANLQLRDSLADNINNSVIMKMDADNAAVTRLLYTITSDQDYIANNLSSLVVTDELMEKAAKVLGENVSPKYLQDLFSVWKGSTGSTGDSIHVYENDATTSMVYLQAIAYTEEQADQIAELMAKAVESAIRQMQDIDPSIECKRIGDVSSAVTSSTIDDIQRNLVTELNNVTSQIYNIECNALTKLSEDEQTYYDLLVSEGKGIHIDEPEAAPTEDTATVDASATVTLTPPSKAKYVALGLIGGAGLVVVILFLYLILVNRKARSLTEIESSTKIPTLAVYERRLSKVKDPIIRAGINLQTGDKAVTDEASYQPILNVRIQELLAQNNKAALYLYNEGESVLADGSDFSYVSGTPDASSAAMQEFLQADSVILVTRMYETEIRALSNVIELCKVHGKQILGNIVIYEG